MLGIHRVVMAVEVAAGKAGRANVFCGADEVLLGGGFDVADPDVIVIRSFPSQGAPEATPLGDGWAAVARNRDEETQTLTAFALCIPIPSAT